MAITINGNGTITGISTGGLPDGCIDAGTLASGLDTQGVTVIDHWRLTTDSTAGAELDLSDWERDDTTNSLNGLLGTGLTVSSGIFTFPQTGIWQVIFTGVFYLAASDDTKMEVIFNVTNDNGTSWVEVAELQCGERSDDIFQTNSRDYIIDITDTSNHKIKFTTNTFSAQTELRGDSTKDNTAVTFIRLGDT